MHTNQDCREGLQVSMLMDSTIFFSEPRRGSFENWKLPCSASRASLLPLCPWQWEQRGEISKVISRFPE